MVKCESCGKRMEEVFLGKIAGTYFREDGKKKAVCSACQSALHDR